MRFPFLAAGLALAVYGTAAQADVCFTVLDKAGRVLHQSRKAPVDMSQPISATLYSRFPNAASMVFGANNDYCEEVREKPGVTPRRATRRM
ncbi:hypothetical protein [Xylophilus sp. GOD-11R]|uniref:hypothetical protein n=1 Tax=Xylophilus sp. GOD-11R TaxID=3089814 RepID=UPI00298D10B9|nr:hypothetical protein [Xylophilus sp. GOD-11R]WPB57394.1 hypothetical protein R9X41_01705 [Xylophilus sp. GOD-11R]